MQLLDAARLNAILAGPSKVSKTITYWIDLNPEDRFEITAHTFSVTEHWLVYSVKVVESTLDDGTFEIDADLYGERLTSKGVPDKRMSGKRNKIFGVFDIRRQIERYWQEEVVDQSEIDRDGARSQDAYK